MIAPATAPIAMPTFAPVDRPPGPGTGVCDDADEPPVVCAPLVVVVAGDEEVDEVLVEVVEVEEDEVLVELAGGFRSCTSNSELDTSYFVWLGINPAWINRKTQLTTPSVSTST